MLRTTCRLCDSKNLWMFLDLGYHPHSDQFRDNKDEPEMTYPLRLNHCEDCGFVQLSHVVDARDLYTKDYLYESSITSTANTHWEEFADTVIKKTGAKGRVLDIGSNDGTLLSKFKAKGFEVVGVDPCSEVTEIANKKDIFTINDFFPSESILSTYPFDLITGTNVFAHVDDLDNFMDGVVSLLKKDGVFVFESPYFGDFLDGLEYDTVYHQHLSYLSVTPLINFFDKYDLEIFDVEKVSIHGGCFRVYIGHKGQREIKPIVLSVIEGENFDTKRLKLFSDEVKKHRQILIELLVSLKQQGKSIAIVSSPAKGMTLMNYCGIKDNLIDFVTEKSSLKVGRYTPGSHIKIVSDLKLLEKQPDYALLLAWNFEKEIRENNKGYKGKWIIPLPEIKIL